MLAAIAIWLYIAFLSITFGLMTKKLIEKFFSFESNNSTSFALIFIMGLGSITTIANYLHLFVNIGLLVNLFLIASSIIYLIIDKEYISNYLSIHIKKLGEINIVVVVLGFIFLLLALYQTTSVTLSADTPLYHALSIRYIEEYSVIPGLGNLYHRLAFNNSWFISNAIFNMSFFGLMQFNVLGTFLLIFSGFYFLSGVNSIINGNYRITNWIKLLYIPILLYSYYYPHLGYTSSPSPDTPSSIFTWILFIFYINKYLRDKKLIFDTENVLLGLISIFLITVKLSVAPIIIPSIYILLMALKNKEVKKVLTTVIMFFIFLLPWFAHNYYLSGYLVHPFPAVNIFNPEWKIPESVALNEKNSIQKWAKWPGWFRKPQVKNETTSKMENVKLESLTYSQWFDVWLKNQSFPKYKYVFYSIPILWILFLLVLGIKRKKILEGNADILIIYFTMIVGYLYWFISAPDLRFGWGFIFANLFIFIVVILHPFFNFKLNDKNRVILLTTIFSLGILLSFYLYYNAISERYGYFNKGFSSDRYLIPKNIDMIYGMKYTVVDGKEILYTSDIYDAQLPAGNNKKHIEKIKFIGEDIQDGFMLNANNNSEAGK